MISTKLVDYPPRLNKPLSIHKMAFIMYNLDMEKKTSKKTNAVSNAVKKTKNTTKKTTDKKAKSLENLKPFPPGTSGNPTGKKKGTRNFSTLVDLAMDNLAKVVVNTHNKKIDSNKKIKHKEAYYITTDDVDIESEIFMQLIKKARSGDQKAIDSFLDRRFGKAVQPITTPDGIGTPEEMEAKRLDDVKKAQDMLNKWTKKKKK